MKPRVLRRTPGRKPRWRSALLLNHTCEGCPWLGPSGACRDPVLQRGLKSGRCGDWIWCVRAGKQYRRHYAKPHDPRTRKQRYWRARLSLASRQYSSLLTEQEVNACIAAAARLRTRPRLYQSGPLTGQQYWVRKECSRKVEVPQPQRVAMKYPSRDPVHQGFARSTWECPHRATGAPPLRRRIPTTQGCHGFARATGAPRDRHRTATGPPSLLQSAPLILSYSRQVCLATGGAGYAQFQKLTL